MQLLKGCYWLFIECILGVAEPIFVSVKYIASDSNFIISFCLLVASGIADFSLTLYKKLWGKFLQISKLFLEVTRKRRIYPFEPCLSLLSSFCWWVVSVPDFEHISLHRSPPSLPPPPRLAALSSFYPSSPSLFQIRAAWNKKLQNVRRQAWYLFKIGRQPATSSSTPEAQSCRPEQPQMEMNRRNNKIAPVDG